MLPLTIMTNEGLSGWDENVDVSLKTFNQLDFSRFDSVCLLFFEAYFVGHFYNVNTRVSRIMIKFFLLRSADLSRFSLFIILLMKGNYPSVRKVG